MRIGIVVDSACDLPREFIDQHAIQIMPITLPPIRVGGEKLSPCAIITGGLTAAVVAGLGLIVLVWRIAA